MESWDHFDALALVQQLAGSIAPGNATLLGQAHSGFRGSTALRPPIQVAMNEVPPFTQCSDANPRVRHGFAWVLPDPLG